MQSFQNSQVVKQQQVEEFARRLIFPISQAAVAVSKTSPRTQSTTLLPANSSMKRTPLNYTYGQ